VNQPSPHAVKDPPNLMRYDSFSLDRLLSHIDPGPAEESEAFVHLAERRGTDEMVFIANASGWCRIQSKRPAFQV